MQTEPVTANPNIGSAKLEFLENGVVVLRLGHPDERVVTLTMQRMQSIREILARLRQQKPPGLVIIGPHADMFTAGADINMIREVTDATIGEKLAREGQTLYDEIEALPFPTVAAISGPCVGGGCEMVLACKYRIISDQKSSSIGLPEVKLGILPGFGGTQRLPRLIGLPKALDIILSGKILKPKQALSVGLVDDIVKHEFLLERASNIAFGAETVNKKKLPFLDRFLTHNRFARSFVNKKVSKDMQRQTKGFYPAPPLALEAVMYGLSRGVPEGLLNEAKLLGKLIVTTESKSLVNVFFLSESSKALGKSAKKAVENLNTLVIGAGTMGAGIAGLLARNEASVILKDTSDEALKRGVDHIKKYLSTIKYLSESERSFILNRIEVCSKESPNISNVNMVIEAVFEDMNLKKTILSDISKITPSDCLIASNTSSLSLSAIAEAVENPERVIGMHFFNPVEKMPLIEIIRGKKTNDKSIAVVAALAVKMGKFPIIVEDVPGFLVNRILTPYLNEAAYLLADGYEVRDIDKAATDFGMPMGPLRLLDEVGLDVASHVSEIMLKGYGDRLKGPGYARVLVDAGRKGKKNNAGFYDFKDKDSTPFAALRDVLKISAGRKENVDKSLLTKRLIYSLINEAVLCLDEGVAGAPGIGAAQQIDLGTVMGMGFPPFRGGLLNYANQLGAKNIYDTLSQFEKTYGARFQPAPGIQSRMSKNLSFYDRA